LPAIALASCGQETAPPLATVAFLLSSDVDLTGHSIRLRGYRGGDADGDRRPDTPVDAAYGCSSQIDECLPIPVDGLPLFQFRGLCPSSGYPAADWEFEYEVWTDDDCGKPSPEAPVPGHRLNDLENGLNLACFDWTSGFDVSSPNRSKPERLLPGAVAKQIVCVTGVVTAEWSFEVCYDRSSDADRAAGTVDLDCGCTVAGGGCACSASTFPPDCFPEPQNDCHVVCWGPEDGAHTATFHMSVGQNGSTGITSPNKKTHYIFNTNYGVGSYTIEFDYGQDKLTARIFSSFTEPNYHLSIPDERTIMGAMNSVEFHVPLGAELTVLRVHNDWELHTIPGGRTIVFHNGNIGTGFPVICRLDVLDESARDTFTISVGRNLRP
jgi:hypothetical protein